MERKQKNDFVPIRTGKNPAASKTHPHQQANLYIWKLLVWTCELDPHPTRMVIRRTWRLCNQQSTHAPPRRDRRGQNTCLCTPHAYVYRSPLSREQWRLALSKLEQNLLRLHSWGRRSDWLLGWAVRYCTDQLLTPYFSGASTINGTPGGDRWVRVLGGQIGWLPEPLHRFDADCSGCTNLKMQTHGKHEKSRPTENTPRNPHQPSDRDHLETVRDETRPTH